MKPKTLSITLTTLTLVLGTWLFSSQPSYGNETTFDCRTDAQGLTSTLSISSPYTPDIPLIQFNSPVFNNWQNGQGQNYAPNIRCLEVALKLQRYFECNVSTNPLNDTFLAAATYSRPSENRYYPVILTVSDLSIQQTCLGNVADINPVIGGLLFMLPPEPSIHRAAVTAKDSLDQIEEIRFYGVGEPIQN